MLNSWIDFMVSGWPYVLATVCYGVVLSLGLFSGAAFQQALWLGILSIVLLLLFSPAYAGILLLSIVGAVVVLWRRESREVALEARIAELERQLETVTEH